MASEQETVDERRRLTASLVAAAVSVSALRELASVSACCATRHMRCRIHQGGRIAGWRWGCIPDSAITNVLAMVSRVAIDSSNALLRSVFQPRDPGFLRKGGEPELSALLNHAVACCK